MEKKTVYAFVGVPSQGMMYSRTVSGSDREIESEIDSMRDFVDCQRLSRPVWMVVPAESASFEQAANQFAKYMQFKVDELNATRPHQAAQRTPCGQFA